MDDAPLKTMYYNTKRVLCHRTMIVLLFGFISFNWIVFLAVPDAAHHRFSFEVTNITGLVIGYVANLTAQTSIVDPETLHTECDLTISDCVSLPKEIGRNVCDYGLESFTLNDGRIYQCKYFVGSTRMFDFIVFLCVSPIIGIAMGVFTMFLSQDIFEYKAPQFWCGSHKSAVRAYWSTWCLGYLYFFVLIAFYARHYDVPYTVAGQAQ